jgi:HAD superfamily hydrolase (TIGR01509 family)
MIQGVVRALIFDFDGVLDTETPLWRSWVHVFDHFGATPIDQREWCDSLGRSDTDPLLLDPAERLFEVVGERLDLDHVQTMRRAERDRLLDGLDVTPGVVRLLDEATAADVAVAIASSSPRPWIDRHLGPRGLLDRFPVTSCAGNGAPGKPNPAVYLRACNELGIDGRTAVAIEDSPHGIAAAKAAGLTCIAIRTSFGTDLDLGQADRVVAALDEISLATLSRTPEPALGRPLRGPPRETLGRSGGEPVGVPLRVIGFAPAELASCGAESSDAITRGV